MTEIIERLHISNWQGAKAANGMFVSTVAIDAPFIGNVHHKLVDGPGNNPSLLWEAIKEVVEKHQIEEENVLVHCVTGRSRSAAVIVGALMQLKEMNLCQAYDFMIAVNPSTRIHPFLSELLIKGP